MENLITFLNSPFFLALVTASGFLVAYLLYRKQKHDSKKDAANIIYLEIAHAEKLLKQAKEGLEKGNLPENVLIMPAMQTESWTKYRYLFVRDLDDKDWNAIEDFYNKCELYDQALEHNNSMFKKNEEQIRISLARFLADYAKDHPVKMSEFVNNDKENKEWQELIKITDNFQNMLIFRSADYIYKPQKPINDVKFYLNNMNLDILQSNVAAKLKKLANLKP